MNRFISNSIIESMSSPVTNLSGCGQPAIVVRHSCILDIIRKFLSLGLQISKNCFVYSNLASLSFYEIFVFGKRPITMI